MLRPKLKQVTTIPLMPVKDYFEKKYQIDTQPYWYALIDDHMFRGNDSSKSFYCTFTNEIPDEAVLDVLPWPENIRDIIVDGTHPGDAIFTAINSVTVQEWADLYKAAVALQVQEEEKDDSTLDEYWPEYLVRGMFEAMVISEYQLETTDDVYYQISW
jgi:hypothetical protein